MSDSNNGLFGSLRRITDLVLATAQNRIELFAVELQEEKCRLVHALLLAAAAIAFGVTALTLITITVVILFWENGRVPALCVLSGLFLLATVLALRALSQKLKNDTAFTASVEELRKDRMCLASNE